MNLLRCIDFLRDRLKAVVVGCCAVLAGVVAADVVRSLTSHGHEAAAAPTAAHAPEHAAGFWASLYHIAETVPVFWTVFGFLGCVLLVVVSKTYGHLGVSEREDYYDE